MFCYTMFDFIQVHKESETETLKCRVLFTFYATTLISVIDSGNVSEQFMSVILPHLSRGMKSAVAEYKAASYMILAQLLHSAKLKPDILKTIQQIIAKVMCFLKLHALFLWKREKISKNEGKFQHIVFDPLSKKYGLIKICDYAWPHFGRFLHGIALNI